MQTVFLRSLVFSCLLLGTTSASATAFIAPPPSIKPDLKAASQVLTTTDAETLKTGLAAVDDGNWSDVRKAEVALRDPTAKDIMTWYRARRDPAMSFDQIDSALSRLDGWPDLDEIRVRAEVEIDNSALAASDRVLWFEEHDGAKTGTGHVVYADALLQMGQDDRAIEQIRRAWHTRSLSTSEKRQILDQWGDQLTQDDHETRADFLLWTRQTSAATRLKPYVGVDW
ncbi:MAG: hypothetical protein AAF296_11870, partial [Pseudomonadota bacterium]